MDPVQISGASIARRLVSCNTTARNRAVRLLTKWLPQQSSAVHPLSDGDLIKIWKGLFYCVWLADKLPFQLDLTNRLSSLLETLDSDLSLRYFESFLITIRREWSGIDFLRLDKVYLLIRKFIHRLFAFLKKNDWDFNLLSRVVGILTEKSLLATDKFQAGGVNYHIAEIFLDEIQGFLPIKTEKFDLLLRPFISVLERSVDKILVSKVKVNVFERLAENGVKCLNGDRNEEEVKKLGKYGLVLGISEKFLKLASDTETVQGNRKILFGLRERFLKIEKDLEKSGAEISFEELSDGNKVEEMTSLAIETVDGVKRLNAKPLKKKRKDKENSDGVEEKSKVKKKKTKKMNAVADGENNIQSNGAPNEENEIETSGVETKCESKKKTTTKKKKNKELSDSAKKNENLSELEVEPNGEIGNATVEENASGNEMTNIDLLNFNESIISNLQKHFEKVAAEDGLAIPETKAKKRKWAKSADKLATTSNGDNTTGKRGVSGEKSVKKVRFSMKNNLVWKPQTPLPPQSLRLPPSATPRGSALKKGVPPGPIKESPATVRKIKANGSSVKKGRKILKSVSPAVKPLKKLQSLSA